jgi:L-ribulokinase
MFAATAAGIYPKVEEAMAAMGQGFDTEYYPEKGKTVLYAKRFHQYKELGGFVEENTKSESPKVGKTGSKKVPL